MRLILANPTVRERIRMWKDAGLESYKGTICRACYTALHGMQAVLALDGIDRRRHEVA